MHLTITRYTGSTINNWYIAKGRDNQGRYLSGVGKTHFEAFKQAINS